MEVITFWHADRAVLIVKVRLDDGTEHRREFDSLDDQDYRDLRIAGQFWKRAELAAALHQPDAVLTEQCLAIEQLFPDLRERLPA